MGSRRRSVLVAAASLLLGMSCGDGGDDGSPPATTTLPLQTKGLAVGGDVQARATDVFETRITEEQLRRIIQACGGATEITTPEGACAELVESFDPTRCTPFDLCIRVYDLSDLDFAVDGYIEVKDDRPNGSLCESEPAHVCLRTGVKTSSVLEQIVASVEPTTSLEGTTTLTSGSTETTSTTAPATSSSSTPPVTSSPTADP